MPFRTPHGKHYHMTQGCHGATIPCDTKGLTPCSDCCGGKTEGAGAGGGMPGGGAGSPQAAGTPASGEGPATGPTRESMERASRWRRSATSALFDPNRQPSDYDKSKVLVGRKSHYERDESGRLVRIIDEEEYADGHKEYPNRPDGEDGGAPSVKEALERAEQVQSAGAAPTAPDGMDVSEMASKLADAPSLGFTESRPDTPHGTEIGKVGQVTVYESHHTSTTRGSGHHGQAGGGDWLYDVAGIHVVAEDGTDLTGTLEEANSLRESVKRDEEDFQSELDAAARRAARAPVNAAIKKAREEWHEERVRRHEEALAQWQDEYRAWRNTPEVAERAERMAAQMRENREIWRHRYIASDVESRLSKGYAKDHPRPTAPRHDPAEAREIDRKAEEDFLRETGYDIDAATQGYRDRLLSEGFSVRRGTRTLTQEGIRKDRDRLDELRGTLRDYGAESLIGLPTEWSDMLGMPNKRPKAWDDAMGGTRL